MSVKTPLDPLFMEVPNSNMHVCASLHACTHCKICIALCMHGPSAHGHGHACHCYGVQPNDDAAAQLPKQIEEIQLIKLNLK